MKQLKRLNYRWALQVILITLLAGLFFYLNLAAPFQAIASQSMVPTLSRGDLIITRSIAPDQIKVGDIIVYRVPEIFQKKYGYFPKVCHRVVRIEEYQGLLSFRTKGDAAGEDPFMVAAADIMGKETRSISYLGYLVMFPQSPQGWVFLIGLVFLYLIYSNTRTIASGAGKLRYALFGLSADEFANSQKEMERKINNMNLQVVQAMNAFTVSMTDYAKHLQSHTSAVKSLAQAAEHLESILPQSKEILIRDSELIQASLPENHLVKHGESNLDILTTIEVTPELMYSFG